jgi:hypothetical protein
VIQKLEINVLELDGTALGAQDLFDFFERQERLRLCLGKTILADCAAYQEFGQV